MGTVAAMFKTMGLKVTGSDQAVYPPMSDFLRDQGVVFHEGYAEINLSPKPDLAVVGNAHFQFGIGVAKVIVDQPLNEATKQAILNGLTPMQQARIEFAHA